EIWEQTGGELDVFVAGMGTGGTISGCGRYFKEKKPGFHVVGVDPIGSLYYDYVKTGRLTRPFSYYVEGIGEDFLPSTMNLKIIDMLRAKPKRPIVTMQRSGSIKEAIAKLEEHGISQLPVTDGGRLEGLVSETDLLNFLVAHPGQVSAPVDGLIEADYATVTP